jgi:hypothetical protein
VADFFEAAGAKQKVPVATLQGVVQNSKRERVTARIATVAATAHKAINMRSKIAVRSDPRDISAG